MSFLYIILALMLFVCLLPMPYGYYVLVRFVAMTAFAWVSYDFYLRDNKPLAFIFASLALLFQPFAKIALGRTMWNVVDVVIGLLLMGLFFYERKK